MNEWTEFDGSYSERRIRIIFRTVVTEESELHARIHVRLCVIRGIDVNVFDEANARAHEAALPVALLRDSPPF